MMPNDAEKLRARANALAQVPTAKDDPQGEFEVVEFQLAYERHAIETKWIREVWPLRQLLPLPGTPQFVAGIIHARGRMVTVIDPKAFFQLPKNGLPDANRVLILSDGALELGLLADSVTQTTWVGRSQLQTSLATLAGLRRDYLLGIAPGALVVLDGLKILRDPRLSVQEESEISRP